MAPVLAALRGARQAAARGGRGRRSRVTAGLGDDLERAARPAPAGTFWLQGAQPSCTVVVQDVEYRCSLGRAPGDEIADWTGTVMPTVDAGKHVNGGCRSLNAEGTEWRCYVGRAAVEQRIIGAGFLGEYAPSPGVG